MEEVVKFSRAKIFKHEFKPDDIMLRLYRGVGTLDDQRLLILYTSMVGPLFVELPEEMQAALCDYAKQCLNQLEAMVRKENN